MDFSSEVLIDFGLNLAGYLIAALLIYIILGRNGRERSQEMPGKETAAAIVKDQPMVTKPASAAAGIARPEFISFSDRADRASRTPAIQPTVTAGPIAPLTPATRKENRRAIYQEARRLLASGKPRSDLLQQLPLTENELELLTVTGKA